jgi:hypothetical protein
MAGPRPVRPGGRRVSAHHEILARAVRALDGPWDTQRAVTVLRDAGVTAADDRAASKQARAALRRLRDAGLLVRVLSPAGTTVYRRVDTSTPEPRQWTARYLRYHHPGEEKFDTLDEAVGRLAWGEEEGALAGVEIVAPDGTVVLEGKALDQAMAKHLGF